MKVFIRKSPKTCEISMGYVWWPLDFQVVMPRKPTGHDTGQAWKPHARQVRRSQIGSGGFWLGRSPGVTKCSKFSNPLLVIKHGWLCSKIPEMEVLIEENHGLIKPEATRFCWLFSQGGRAAKTAAGTGSGGSPKDEGVETSGFGQCIDDDFTKWMSGTKI